MNRAAMVDVPSPQLQTARPASLTRDITVPFIITRLGLTIIAWLAFQLAPLRVTFPGALEIANNGDWHPAGVSVSPREHAWLNMWSRWDAVWYAEIAQSGYHFARGEPSSVAFFPLYPLLIRALHTALSLPASVYWWLVCGLIISNACLIGTLVYLRRLILLDFDGEVASNALLYLLVFPTTFFLSSVYTESIFLLTTVAAFYYGRANRWVLACSWAALATLTRSQGAILVVPLLYEYAAQRRFNFRRIKPDFAAFLLIPIALAAFAFFLKQQFGSWTIMFQAQQSWGRTLTWPWHPISWLFKHSPPLSAEHHDWLDFSFLIFLLIVSAIGARQLRTSYSVYAFTCVVFFSSWGMFGSMPRFVLVVFPLFVALAVIFRQHRRLHLSYLIICSMLAAFLMVVHSQWNWVA